MYQTSQFTFLLRFKMKFSESTRCLRLFALSALIIVTYCGNVVAAPPNVVIIYADDMGCY
tara:strand:- start:752429 stop:752608 length:180 start_codon:yes stop_codon:yes gene_type:complete